ncbi:hypothetical protein [uncultured Methanospirillum sp.]|uniref:hypothetical protein n=1 Tax=uncultured Methanospirillum sp. TaxID=262503 RepID=UPI0029C5FC6E|nr:hypothetical protein [uncultured Methanospirillum sp.]
MNKYSLALLVMLTATILISAASAHPPSDLNLTYNQTSGNLSATFTHQVADPATHYLKDVTVAVDGKEVVNEKYTSQPTSDEFTYIYPVNASVGSVIDVSGQCNIGGSIKRSITV